MKRKKRNIFSIICLIVCIFTHFVIFGNESITRIPFELVDNYIFVKVRINNSAPLTFGFDTGADGTVIDLSTADRLGFKTGESIPVSGMSGSVTASLIRNKNLRIGQLRLNGVMLYALSLENMEGGLGRDIDGIIGGLLLGNHPVKIDFDRKVIEFYAFDHFNYKGRGDTIPFRLAGQAMPLISAELTLEKDRRITGVFGLDTGFGSTVLLNAPFVEKNRMAVKIGRCIKLDYIGVSGVKRQCLAGRLKKVRLGKALFRNVPALFSQVHDGGRAWQNNNGVIGNAVLKKFNIIFNFRRWHLILEPNRFYYNDFRVNCSGLRLSLDKSKTRVFVYDVIDDSPAAKAGIKKGDEILSINGKNVRSMALSRIRDILNEAGREVKVILRRSYGRRTFIFRLRELI